MIRKHLEENKDVIRVDCLPKGSPEYNAVEECCRQGKDVLLVSTLSRIPKSKEDTPRHYRTKRRLDITNYLS